MATAQLERSSQGFRPDVQGLRAVAVGLVLLYHFGLLRATGGFVGVDVFFVISGFVIAGLIFREVESKGRLSIADFYARRARRILPASTLTLIVTVSATVVLFGRLGALNVAHDAVASALFVANFHFIAQGTDYFASNQPASPLLHFWSLAVEEQFYFVFPSLVALVALVSKRVRRHISVLVAIIVAGSFAWSIIQTSNQPTTAYFSIATRAWELGIGVLVAAALPRIRAFSSQISWALGGVGVLAIGWSAWALKDGGAYPGSIAAVPVLGAALLILAGTSGQRVGPSRFLSLPPLIVMGDLSFSLYLWHFPVIALADRYHPAPLSLGYRLALLALAVILAVVSYRLIEHPIRSSASLRRLPSRSLLVGALCVALSLAVAFVPIKTVQGGAATIVKGHPALRSLSKQVTIASKIQQMPSSTDPALVPFLTLENFGIKQMITTARCNPPTEVTVVGLCVYGDHTSKYTVVLYGNSQAQMWAPAFDRFGKTNHFRIIAIAKPACGTFVDDAYLGPQSTVSPICTDFVNWSIRRMNALHPRMIFVASTTGEVLRPGADPNVLGPNGRLPKSSIMSTPPARTALDFQKFVLALKPSGAKIVLMGDVPIASPGVLHGLTATGCLIANQSNIQQCAIRRPTFSSSAWRRSFILASTLTKVPLVNVDALLCTNVTCPPVVSRILVHFDQLHLTRQYVMYTTVALGELMKNYLPSPRAMK